MNSSFVSFFVSFFLLGFLTLQVFATCGTQPTNVAELKQSLQLKNISFVSGNYQLCHFDTVTKELRLVTVFVNSVTERTYLNLQQPNTAIIYAPTIVITTFNKIRINLPTLQIYANDYSYATTNGLNYSTLGFDPLTIVPLGTGIVCNSDFLQFVGQIDLTGTPFSLNEEFTSFGSGFQQNNLSPQISQFNLAGDCGFFVPSSWTNILESVFDPSYTADLAISLSFIESAKVSVIAGARQVVKYTPGLQKNGQPLRKREANPVQALGLPATPSTTCGLPSEEIYTSLGFGGSIILEFQPSFSGNITIYEYSDDDDECNEENPDDERFQVFLSTNSDQGPWVQFGGTFHRDNTFSDSSDGVEGVVAFEILGDSNNCYRFVKIVDVSNSSFGSSRANGVDIVAVTSEASCQDPVETFYGNCTIKRDDTCVLLDTTPLTDKRFIQIAPKGATDKPFTRISDSKYWWVSNAKLPNILGGGSARDPYKGNGYLIDSGVGKGDDKYVQFIPPTQGYFDIYFWWTDGIFRAQNVRILVRSRAGLVVYTINQAENANRWSLIASNVNFFKLQPTDEFYIRISSSTGNGISIGKPVSVDALLLCSTGVIPSDL